jgi:hypothetical protein
LATDEQDWVVNGTAPHNILILLGPSHATSSAVRTGSERLKCEWSIWSVAHGSRPDTQCGDSERYTRDGVFKVHCWPGDDSIGCVNDETIQ